MKAVVLREYGGPEVLRLEEYPDLIVGAGEVLIRVAAAGINLVDTLERAGATKDWNPLKFPAVIGWDLSGTILEIGASVKDFAVGDEVCAWAYHTYAERCVVKADLLAKIPKTLGLVDAAALPLVSLTGGQLISVASSVKAGQTVLVAGAAGSVGRSAVFTAKKAGAVVIAGVQQKQLNGPTILGADQLVALHDDAATARLAPVDVVANTVRGKTAEMLLGLVKGGGTFASVTGAPQNEGDHPSVRVVAFVSKQDAKMLSHMVEAAAAGKLVIPIDRRIPLKDAALGHAAVEKGGIGKGVAAPMKPSVLIVLTGATVWTMKDGTPHPCGFWAIEFIEAHQRFTAAGLQVSIATPGGVAPQVDPLSYSLAYNNDDANAVAEQQAYIKNLEGALASPLRLEDVTSESFDVIFLVGGHGPMQDLAVHPTIGALLAAMLDDPKKIVAAACHGLASFLSAHRADGTWLFKDRILTGFSNEEETQATFAGNAPWLLEDRVRLAGARYKSMPAWTTHVVVDGNLVTGQQNVSSGATADAVLKQLKVVA